jgi:heat shock protein beta
MAELLYDTALVTSGFSVDSPRDFAARIFSMMGLAVGAPAPGAGAPAAAAEPQAAAVDPEVLGADGSDPWRQ